MSQPLSGTCSGLCGAAVIRAIGGNAREGSRSDLAFESEVKASVAWRLPIDLKCGWVLLLHVLGTNGPAPLISESRREHGRGVTNLKIPVNGATWPQQPEWQARCAHDGRIGGRGSACRIVLKNDSAVTSTGVSSHRGPPRSSRLESPCSRSTIFLRCAAASPGHTETRYRLATSA
jgi:hypothetical protein